MSKKTHGQRVRRKKDLVRRKRETGSVISWNTNAFSPDANSRSNPFILSFSFLVLAIIISLIILAIYVLIT